MKHLACRIWRPAKATLYRDNATTIEQDGFLQALEMPRAAFRAAILTAPNRSFGWPFAFVILNYETQSSIRESGRYLRKKGNFDEAIRLNMRLLATQAGKGASPQVASTMERVAALYEMVGRLEEAEYMHGKARAVMDRLC